jgi:hypothetical protein
MVNVDSPRWQWHLNGSRLFPMLYCVLYKEIKMAAFFIFIVILFLLLVGGEILIWDVMHFWECLYFCCIGLCLKLWMDFVYYCRIDEIDVLYWSSYR